MIREIATRFSKVLAERRAAERFKIEVPARVSFEPIENRHNLTGSNDELHAIGLTRNMSVCGLGIIVTSIRLKENYLVGEGRILRVELHAYGKKIMLKVIGRRYEDSGIHHSTERYLIGVEIIGMTEQDRRNYEHLLKHHKKLAKMPMADLELGLD